MKPPPFWAAASVVIGFLLGQLVSLAYINWEMMGGLVYFVPMFGRMVEIPQQGLAVLAVWMRL